MNELVTAVITTYKRKTEILQRAVESVVHQSWRPLELFVVNDYPEDGTLGEGIEIMLSEVQKKNLDVNIQYIALKHNSGACVARNMGLALANGEFISFLDDDDTWEKSKIEEQRKGFLSDSVGMVYSPFYNVGFDNERKLVVRGDESGNLLELLLYRNIIGGTSMPMMRTSALRDIGGFDSELLSSQDYDTWIRVAEKYEIQFVSEPLTVRYLTDESITTNLRKKEQGWKYFTKKHMKYYVDNKRAFEYRLSLMISEIISLGDNKFVDEVLNEYQNYYGNKIKVVYMMSKIKLMIKKMLKGTIIK